MTVALVALAVLFTLVAAGLTGRLVVRRKRDRRQQISRRRDAILPEERERDSDNHARTRSAEIKELRKEALRGDENR